MKEEIRKMETYRRRGEIRNHNRGPGRAPLDEHRHEGGNDQVPPDMSRDSLELRISVYVLAQWQPAKRCYFILGSF